MSDTDEHTPVSSEPRTKEQDRQDWTIRALKVVVGPLMAAIVALGLGYIQRNSDKADANKKADNAVGSVKPATDELTKELAALKAQVATISAAGAATAKLTVEAHDAAPKPGRRRPRQVTADADLLKQVQENIGTLERVKAKAEKPLAVPVVPATVPDKLPDPRDGGGGATSSSK